MIINAKDGMIHEVFSVGFHANDAVAMIITDVFSTTRGNTPIVRIKNNGGIIQIYRLPLELEYWVLSCMCSASAGKNPFSCKVAFGIIDNKFYVELK